MTTGYQKMIENQQQMLEQWQDLTRQMFKPFLETMPPSHTTENKDEKPSPVNKVWEDSAQFWKDWMEKSWGWAKVDRPSQWWQKNYNGWSNPWFKLWETSLGIPSEKNPASLDVIRKSMFGLLKSYPTDQWSNLLTQYNKQLENYIKIVEDIDLPFDEIAASWEKMLEVYYPQENLPFSMFSTMGDNASNYIEMMVYPLYGIVEPPNMIAHLKLWSSVQFYFLSFLFRNMELRGKVLEVSLAAWPEALKAANEQFEQSGNAPSLFDFYEDVFSRLEGDLYELMKSTDYIQAQEKIVETMVMLKSQLNKWFEVGTAAFPLATQSDLNDIAQEMEALRVKIRKMGEKKPETSKKKAKSDVSALN
jgi:hypothetical protein